ncbi:MAG TPA: ABC transporter permease [Spirochaetales bacterium]|nr:ABC transporter permease [Spirochaetales bacterium]HPS15182.1 ABC transporter permease [Spirochaetales bacterium]
MTKRSEKLVLPVISIVLGFLVGTVIIVATGRSVSGMFTALFKSFTGIDLSGGQAFNPRYIGEFVVQTMPIILTGLSFAFAARTGLFCIGAEGQLMVGSAAATAAALYISAPAYIHVPLVLLSAMLAGALWGAIPGFLKAYFNVPEVTVSIMLNYVGLYLNNFLVLNVFGSADRIKTAFFPQSALLESPFLESITRNSRLNWGFIPVILMLFLFSFIINKTTFGYSLRAVGYNKEAARYAGMKVRRNIVVSLMIAGAFSGLAGAVITTGTFNFGRVIAASEGYGFDGIAVALVGSNEAIGILLAGMLFGMLKAAQPLMQVQGIPREIAGIIQAAIVLFVAMQQGIKMIIEKLEKRKASAPVAEGERV